MSESEPQKPYDSKIDTYVHMDIVASYIGVMCRQLFQRAMDHDRSKLEEPEKSAFDRETPLLKELTFGSDEYKASLERLKEALTHHYKHNSHHPEHYENGVAGMDIIDVVEMLCDWKAASQRNKGGTLNLQACFERFNIESQLQSIFTNTAIRLGWI